MKQQKLTKSGKRRAPRTQEERDTLKYGVVWYAEAQRLSAHSMRSRQCMAVD